MVGSATMTPSKGSSPDMEEYEVVPQEQSSFDSSNSSTTGS